jgi:hypothetical protein
MTANIASIPRFLGVLQKQLRTAETDCRAAVAAMDE